jgi:hypothetical protein
MVAKHTGIGDANKKEKLFDRHVPKINAYYILWVEGPNTPMGKESVPYQEKGCREDARPNKGFPVFEKLQSGMKGKQKGEDDAPKIDQQVGVFFCHFICLF